MDSETAPTSGSSQLTMTEFAIFLAELFPEMHKKKSNQMNLPLETLLVQALHVHPVGKEEKTYKKMLFASTS